MKRKSKASSGVGLYKNLATRRKTKRDASSRQHAEYLATLPKHPVKRTLYRMHPKRMAGFWFSKKGGMFALKAAGIGILIFVLAVGALFAYFRKDLDAIRPGEIAKRVQTTVTKYYDRNDVLLWEDKGEGNYTLVVDGDKISKRLKQATIAIEDRDFYKHGGVSVQGLTRAALSNTQGNSTQGGSTLTQQLVKQVFFADESTERGLAGIPRKIKEMILAIEVERMYSKDEILNLYLNESPYGGRRNGAESAAQTYFGKSAAELTLAESALLAAIPNQPGFYDPYNVSGNKALLARQHRVLDNMVDMGYINQSEAKNAKDEPILDTIKPQSEQFANIKAPHFVQYVRSELESQLGKAVVGRGGLTVKTTLDYRVQQKLEESMNGMFNSYVPAYAGFSNGAASVEDVKTGQVIALLGSRDFNYPGFGQDNAATAYIQPGSSIKPLVFAELFQDKGQGQQNYGSGSILADDRSMDKIYGAPLKNADGGYRGNINIRRSLGLSRNVPAVKAMHINGIEKSWQTIRALGDKGYCTQGPETQAGLSSAIGGCGTRLIDHTNAFASLARGGVYKPHSTVLEVKNNQGSVIKKYADESKQVIDPQAAYIVSDILQDPAARAGLWTFGIPNVRTAVKTGTSDKGGKPKDIWTVGYTPALSMSVWLGNPDNTVLTNGRSNIPAEILKDVFEYAHTQIYAPEGKWTPNQWFDQPQGIQRIGGELYPSYYNKSAAQSNAKLMFDRVSKKKATSCTPEGAKIEIGVTKIKDPITKKDVFIAPDGYNPNADDDAHSCGDAKPSVGTISVSGNKASISLQQGKFPLQTVEVGVDGASILSQQVSGSGTVTAPLGGRKSGTITVTLTDHGYYTASGSYTIPASSSNPND